MIGYFSNLCVFTSSDKIDWYVGLEDCMSKNSHPQVISLITSHMYSARHCFIIFRLNIEFSSPVLSISHLGQTNRTSSILSHPVKSRRRSSWVWATTSIRSQRNCCAGASGLPVVASIHTFIHSFSLRRDFEASTSSWSSLFSGRAFSSPPPEYYKRYRCLDSWCKIILSPCYQEWNYSSG